MWAQLHFVSHFHNRSARLQLSTLINSFECIHKSIQTHPQSDYLSIHMLLSLSLALYPSLSPRHSTHPVWFVCTYVSTSVRSLFIRFMLCNISNWSRDDGEQCEMHLINMQMHRCTHEKQQGSDKVGWGDYSIDIQASIAISFPTPQSDLAPRPHYLAGLQIDMTCVRIHIS